MTAPPPPPPKYLQYDQYLPIPPNASLNVNFSEYGDRCHADIEAQLREDYGLIDADLEPAPFLGAAEPIVQHGAPLASKPHMTLHEPMASLAVASASLFCAAMACCGIVHSVLRVPSQSSHLGMLE